jgi:hypothetical protein
MADPATLRLRQRSSQGTTHVIDLEWRGAGAPQLATATVNVALSNEDQ